MSHETLLAKVWGYEYREEEHYVRLYITYLRQKIEPDPSHPKYILTERGLGYRFVDYRERAGQNGQATNTPPANSPAPTNAAPA
jgi:two-component system KDP operon response regulator KdpE